MTQEEKLDSLLEAMRSQPHKDWTGSDLAIILPSDVRAELGRLSIGSKKIYYLWWWVLQPFT